MRVVGHEDAVALAARDDQVGAGTQPAAVRNEHACSVPTPGLAGIGDAELGVAQMEQGAISNRDAVEVGSGGALDYHVIWRAYWEVGVEALYINAPHCPDVDADLHIANGGVLHSDVS